MNSMSKGYYDSCGKEKRKEENVCQALVKCGCPRTVQVPALTIGTSTDLNLASLTIDTSGFCNPNIKLDFTSNIISSLLFAGTITIQIYKQCKGQLTPVPVGPAWEVGTLAALSSTTFSFFVCDSDSCTDECCTYTVVATVNAVAAVSLGTSINNATLAATVTCNDICNKCRK